MTIKNKKLILGLGSVLLILLLAGAGVFAWYMNLSSNYIKPQTLQVTTTQFLEVRQAVAAGEEENEFSSALLLEFDNLTLVDITGDGTTLVRPRLIQNGDETTGVSIALPDTSDDTDNIWGTPIANEAYIDVPLEFRSNRHLAVYLGAGSAVTPHCGVENAIGANAGNRSNYGAFSRDLIAGAVRVAFVSSGANPHTVSVWEPNSDYELYYYAGDAQGEGRGWFFDMDSANAETPHKYYYVGANNAKIQDNLEAHTIPVILDSGVALNTADIGFPTGAGLNGLVVELIHNSATGFYEGSVTLRIWIEGCDREARRAVAGGEIDVELFFNGYELAN